MIKTRLYRVAFEIKPTATHPNFEGISSGVFCVFLFDESAESAAIRGRQILDNLPYELTNEKALVTTGNFDNKKSKFPDAVEKENVCVANAWATGVAFILHAVARPGHDGAEH